MPQADEPLAQKAHQPLAEKLLFLTHMNLEKSILATICYFDIFDYPLTLVEIRKWLWNSSPRINVRGRLQAAFGVSNESLTQDPSEIQDVLDNNPQIKSLIESRQGFYFLKGREKIVRTRLDRYNIADRKFKKAIKIVRLLRFIPFLKMLAVCNTLGYSNTKEESDIDFFIITSPGRIWLVRFFSLSLLAFLGLRVRPTDTRDKFCLNFFVTADNLNLQETMLNQNDIHFIYWLSQFVPIYREDNIYEKFVQANQWLKNYLPNSSDFQPNPRRQVKPILRPLKRLIELAHSFAFNGLSERFYKWLQLKIMPEKLKAMANQDTRVIIKDNILKFHLTDRREYYNNLFASRFSLINSMGDFSRP